MRGWIDTRVDRAAAARYASAHTARGDSRQRAAGGPGVPARRSSTTRAAVAAAITTAIRRRSAVLSGSKGRPDWMLKKTGRSRSARSHPASTIPSAIRAIADGARGAAARSCLAKPGEG
jgi:hypothetical protein